MFFRKLTTVTAAVIGATVLGIGWLGVNSAEAALLVKQFNNSGGGLSNLSDTDALIGGAGVVSSASGLYDVVNFSDVGYSFFNNGVLGNGFGSANPFPNSPNNDSFAVHVTGYIDIPTAGNWSFGTASDDGLRLSINGNPLIVDDSLHADVFRSGSVNLSQGKHFLDLVFFENSGGATLELFANQGNSIDSNTARLIGDIEHGGLATSQNGATAVPTPALLPGLIGLGVAALRKRKSEKAEA